jgi:beta-glucanase (GH16 family)
MRRLFALAALSMVAAAVTLTLVNAGQISRAPKPKHPTKPVAAWACKNCGFGRRPLGVPGRWRVIFTDRFAGQRLNTTLWSTGWFGSGITEGPGRKSSPSCYAPADVQVNDGLTLSAVKQAHVCGHHTHSYTGGIITTYRKLFFKYGVMQARIWLPQQAGALYDHAAFWADGLHWPYDGEIDIVEVLSGRPCFVFHYAGGVPSKCPQLSGATRGWHTYAVDWQPGKITWYYDGHPEWAVRTQAASRRMFLIIGNGYDPSDGLVPASMKVSYVRIWATAARG